MKYILLFPLRLDHEGILAFSNDTFNYGSTDNQCKETLRKLYRLPAVFDRHSRRQYLEESSLTLNFLNASRITSLHDVDGETAIAFVSDRTPGRNPIT